MLGLIKLIPSSNIEMKKIAVIGLRGFPGVQGGVEVHCENLYPLFSEDTLVTVYRRIPYITSYSDKKYHNISFRDFPSTRIKGFEAMFHTFLSCCSVIKNNPDAVHIHNIGPGMFTPLLKLFGQRVCVTYHSPNYEHKKWGFFAKKILKLSEWLSLRFADDVIFVNKFQMEKVGGVCKGGKHYLPNGMKKVTCSQSTDFLQKNGIIPGEYVLAVGRITQEKGFDVLIKAVSASPEVKQLVIAGACDHDSEYFNLLKALDVESKVVFTGFTTGEDLRQLYSHASLFVLSSFNEGFPLVLLEAMGYGLPLLVSDIPATHLLPLPVDAYVPVGDVNEFATALKRKSLSHEGKQEYDLTEFDWDSIAKKTESILLRK